MYITIAIVAILVVAGGAALLLRSKGNNSEQQSNQQNMNQDQTQQNQASQQAQQQPQQTPEEAHAAAALQAQVAGCPNGTDTNSKTDANGRFVPTLDISKKVVTLQTSMGAIQIQMFDKDAPKTVENFVCLAEKGYYDGVTFHRVSHGFVIQGGDPTGTGKGGDSVYGGAFQDELYPDTASFKAGYLKGVVAMANAGPNTNTSQFFIMLADHPELPSSYTIFGKVVGGQDVVDSIGALPVAASQQGQEDGPPTTTVTITKATVK